MEIDLDAARAAKAERKAEGHSVKVGGETFTLPPMLPFGFLEAAFSATTAEEVQHAIRILLGPDQFDRFLEQRIDDDDLDALMDGVFKAYTGHGQGKSSASASSSSNGSSRSRPTSNGSTASTSRKRSGGKNR